LTKNKDAPWGQLPILNVGDKTLAQTTTICRYLARKFKLTGADEWEAAKCDEYVDAMNDLSAGVPYYHHLTHLRCSF